MNHCLSLYHILRGSMNVKVFDYSLKQDHSTPRAQWWKVQKVIWCSLNMVSNSSLFQFDHHNHRLHLIKSLQGFEYKRVLVSWLVIGPPFRLWSQQYLRVQCLSHHCQFWCYALSSFLALLCAQISIRSDTYLDNATLFSCIAIDVGDQGQDYWRYQSIGGNRRSNASFSNEHVQSAF